MSVNSKLGEGTTLTLLLPLIENEDDIAGDPNFSDLAKVDKV